MKIVFLGIGSNLGDRKNNLDNAVGKIDEYIGKVVASSSIYETEPWGFEVEEEFLNMVVKVETRLEPSGMLGRILMIEALLGRIRSEKQYSSRVIDIDILLYEGLVLEELTLKIPHPLMHKRRFVLVPLCEIEPEIVHPVMKKTVKTLLELCTDNSNVRKY
jgi:2-amino-4-hydroxy-6-hydroxymethyldihydropteridine diphosphokinase